MDKKYNIAIQFKSGISRKYEGVDEKSAGAVADAMRLSNIFSFEFPHAIGSTQVILETVEAVTFTVAA